MVDKKTTASAYRYPLDPVTVEIEEKKSRFIASLQFADSKAAAVDYFQSVRKTYPGASHYCSAFIIGNPESPDDAGCSDDGEPSGCAGKPMLNVLYHDRVGNVAVVVTRYYGGIKLGTGGLVRAYAGAVKAVLGEAVFADYVKKQMITLSFHYHYEGGVRHLIKKNQGTIADAVYGMEVSFDVVLPASSGPGFLEQLCELTGGSASIANNE